MTQCKTHNNCLEKAIKEAEEICEKNNLQFTQYRRKTLELIWKSHAPVKAYDLLKNLDEKTLQPPTIYRALDFLLEHKLIHKIESLNAYTGCIHPSLHNCCYFLICEKCNSISECCDKILSHSIEEIANKNKFQIKNINLEISGICHECESDNSEL